MLEVRLLGAFQIQCGKKSVSLASRSAQSLFAFLILNAGIFYRRERLAGQLWPESTEESARDYLRHALWRVRKALQAVSSASYLKADDLAIAFDASADYWMDAAAFQQVSEHASPEEFMTALSAYKGELLPGFYDEWVFPEREHLQAIFEQEMGHLLDLLQESGRWSEVLEWGEKWIGFGQKPEPAYRALMRAHAANGDMSKLAAVYERCVKSLQDFGVTPSEQTKSLFESLKSGRELGISQSTLTAHSPKQRSSSGIPVPFTNFIGREKEIDEIVALFKNERLVTLVGSGGVGKTRLAAQASNQLSTRFRHGVRWIELAGLGDPTLVPQAVAAAVGAREVPNQPIIDTLTEHLRSREMLLVIDNCEHLISACAHLADRLLGTCAVLRILATSRESLAILGETAWPVPSLGIPEASESIPVKTLSKFESIRLFTDRAASVQPKFELVEQNARAIAQICRRLDGMPLAIELAAARVKVLSVDEIARRLDDRFGLLTSGNRAALPRHQTLRATLDWSYELLPAEEQRLFRRLAVFAGGFTLKAAEHIAAEGESGRSWTIDLLERLINKSLVMIPSPSGGISGETRYGMLETIREYARGKTSAAEESAVVRDLHLQFFMNLVAEAEPRLEHEDQQIWLDQLELEADNLRAAIDWALESTQMEYALQLVGGLRRFWFLRQHHNEGVERLEAILQHPEARKPTPARLKALTALFFMYWPWNQVREVQPLIEEALELSAALGDRWHMAFALLWLGVSATAGGDYGLAHSRLEESLGIWREVQDTAYEAWAFVFLSDVALIQGDFSSAAAYCERSVPPLRVAGDYPMLAIPLRRLGQLALYQGDLLKAKILIRESLDLNWSVGDYRGLGACLAALAELNAVEGHALQAAELVGVVDSVLEFIHTSLLPFDQRQYENTSVELRTRMGEKAFARHWGKGKKMTIDQAVAAALDESAPKSASSSD